MINWLRKLLGLRFDIKIKLLYEGATVPSYAKDGDAGMDLTATKIDVDEYGNFVYYTGLAMEIPKGYVGLIFPRSSVSKYCLDLANAVGVIDSGYRGEIICKFKPTPQKLNYGSNIAPIYNESYEVGDRVAQIIIMELPKIRFMRVEELPNTDRGVGGFGSSGK